MSYRDPSVVNSVYQTIQERAQRQFCWWLPVDVMPAHDEQRVVNIIFDKNSDSAPDVFINDQGQVPMELVEERLQHVSQVVPDGYQLP